MGRFAVWSVVLVMVVGCSSRESSPSIDAVASTATTASTTIPINRPPELRVSESARAEIGQRLTEPIVAFDPDGDDVVVRLGESPPGFGAVVNVRGRVTGFEWSPTVPGRWVVEVSATDPAGLVAEQSIELIGRAPRSVDLVLAMGDSLAAGYGRDRSDFFSDDPCFRSEPDAYGLRVAARLVEVGALEGGALALTVACAGASLSSVENDPVTATDPNGDRYNGDAMSQVEWAARLNPTIVTLSIGGGDVGLLDGERFGQQVMAVADAGDQEMLPPSIIDGLDAVEADLTALLQSLLDTTDSHVAITTYYDPTAGDPLGVDGCEGQCFAAASQRLVAAVNERIRVSASIDSARVSVVALDGVSDVWEAPNGLGPDALREGLGPLQGVVDRFTGGSAATCAGSGEPEFDYVSSIDCVHPNRAGHAEIADRVVDVLLSL